MSCRSRKRHDVRLSSAVFAAAAILSGYRGTYSVSPLPAAHVLLTLFHRRRGELVAMQQLPEPWAGI